MNSRSSRTALIATLSLVAANGTPSLELNARRLTTRQILQHSAIAVIGRVLEIRPIGNETQTNEGVRVKLYEISIDRELTLQGRLQEKRVVFCLYNYDPNFVRNGDFEWLAKGDP